MTSPPTTFAMQRFVHRVAEALAGRDDVEDVRSLLLQRATTDELADRRLFIEMVLAMDKIGGDRGVDATGSNGAA